MDTPKTEAGREHRKAVLAMHARLRPEAGDAVQWATIEWITAGILAIEAEAAAPAKARGGEVMDTPTTEPRQFFFQEGLDVERLARALEAADLVIVDNDYGIVTEQGDLETIAIEYEKASKDEPDPDD